MTADAQTLKPHIPMLLLAVLQRGTLTGSAIKELLGQAGHGQFEVPDQNVYPALHRLEHFGFIASTWSVQDGRHVRAYQLTPEGWIQLSVYRRTWNDFVGAITALLEAPSQSNAP